MTLLPVYGVASGLISVIACVPYFRDILSGHTRPERATWLIWSVLGVITVASQRASGATWSLLFSITIALVALTTFILSIKYGEGGVTQLDIISLCIAALGLSGWALTDDPLIALIFMIFVDAIAVSLTIRKSYYEPETETMATWQLYTVSSVLGFLAVGKIDLALLLYPGYLTIANGTVIYSIILGRKRQKKK